METLAKEGLLTTEECEEYDFGQDKRYIEYDKIYFSRFKILRKAFDRSRDKTDIEYENFKKENDFWLKDYTLYTAVKRHFNEVSWNKWDDDIKLRTPEAVKRYSEELKDDIEFYKFIQFKFWEQWNKLKNYANKNKIKIIGDIPIYVAFDSADSWSNPQLFKFDKQNNPIEVAGCPPDGFSLKGQLWGSPIYDWDYHKKTSYSWWIQRILYCFKLYDVVRIDHFRGFDEYYTIPFGQPTAEFGHWEKGPGLDFFHALNSKIGKVEIIAEDLGFVTDSVRKLVKDTGYPGMKVLEFAFDSREENDYLPHNYEKNCVVYTGTHDNDTIKGWYKSLPKKDKQMSIDYLGNEKTNFKDIHWDFIRLALSSVANYAIIPIQDYLGLGEEARMNTPSTVGGNWKWRLLDGEITKELSLKIKKMVKLYSR